MGISEWFAKLRKREDDDAVKRSDDERRSGSDEEREVISGDIEGLSADNLANRRYGLGNMDRSGASSTWRSNGWSTSASSFASVARPHESARSSDVVFCDGRRPRRGRSILSGCVGAWGLFRADARDRGTRHGGSVRVIGDAVMAVAGTAEHLATGDAVNVAARLEQTAQPGEVLVGEATLALVRAAADVEPLGPLELKGKSAPVPAYRVLRLHDPPERSRRELFVGREHELAILRATWERVHTERRCELATVAGDAGVGKSRLAAESLAGLDATITRGRCLPYGEGITYWPVVEVLKQLNLSPPDAAAAVAMRTLLGETGCPRRACVGVRESCR